MTNFASQNQEKQLLTRLVQVQSDSGFGNVPLLLQNKMKRNQN